MPDFDLLIRNARVIDGTNSPEFQADVAVRGDRIEAVAPGLKAGAARVIEAAGLVLSPGFIDVHTHDDTNVIRTPDMLPKITQGVTTVIVGNCGISAASAVIRDEVPDPMNLLGEKDDFAYPSVAAYREAVDKARPAVNVATLIGHTTLRVNHMDDLFRPASAAELAAMRTQLRQALKEGALGLSSGLSYATALEAPAEEVMSLAGELAAGDGLYATHLRTEFQGILDSMEEAFRVGRHGRVPVVISHHKCSGRSNWGRTRETLALLDQTREHQDVCCDCYPYTAGSSTLDPKQINAEIRIDITWSKPHPEMAGQTLAAIAAAWQVSQEEAGARLMPAGAIYHQMDEGDVRRVLAWSGTMIGSDGLPNDPLPHPRLWGTFPRVLGHYSRDLKLFPLTEAVYKMTGMSARRFRLPQRGLIRPGCFADLVLFNPDTVIDTATYERPKVPAAGIEAVIVNGVLTCTGQKPTGLRAGRFLTRWL